MKSYLRRTGATLLLGIFLLPVLTPSVQPQTRPWWFYGWPKGVVPQIPGDVPAADTAGWTQYQSCLQQNLSLSPQQSAQIAPILANEGRQVIAIRNNNSLSNVQKTQESYVPPETVRSAVEGDSLICSIRQTKSRPLSGRPMGHSEKTRLAVREFLIGSGNSSRNGEPYIGRSELRFHFILDNFILPAPGLAHQSINMRNVELIVWRPWKNVSKTTL
jgi:hypothetical protein